MNFRSIDDLSAVIRNGLWRIPTDIDVVVGVPRSGMLAAMMIGLHRNVMIADLDGFLEGRAMKPGESRDKPHLRRDPSAWKKALVVDDSVSSGTTFTQVRARLAEARSDIEIITCAVFGLEPFHRGVDVVLSTCPQPRVFEWNLLHHAHLMREACLDIDGVLCVDPSEQENDDGESYVAFLKTARPHLTPTVPIGHLVTSRLERYRSQTEGWLAAHGIRYGRLHMLDLPSAAERRRQGAHGTFKARVYSSLPNSRLFIESEPDQARKIASLSGKAVICVDGMFICDQSSLTTVKQATRHLGHRILKRLRNTWRGWSSPRTSGG